MKIYRRYLHLFAVVLIAVLMAAACHSPEDKAAYGVLKRTFGACPSNVSLVYAGPADSTSWYSLEVRDGRLTISGSSSVALCKGFHDYIQDHGYGSATWSGAVLRLPGRLPDMEKVVVTSPYERHLFYNVCTFGYTAGYWGWEEWQKDIDWLALHGFDMPLAPVGTEAILYRVYLDLGLSDEEIQAYFSGPAHFPWMRMGNMCAQDGGMSRAWHEKQVALAHRILRRMKSLGMSPVFQGFAGFVPEAVQDHFPEVSITRNDWHGLHNQFLSAKDALFQTIGSAFIKEWEKEFGKGKYYLVDSFNEMDIPFGDRGTPERYENIKAYASATYKSIHDANPDAVWVMQGWMFGRDRTRIWDTLSVKALLDGAPDDKLMIIDLAVDFNEFVWRSEKDWLYLGGFYGKEWIWSTTPNFGGRSSLKGHYDFYLNAHLDALSSPEKGRLTGFGSSPEGTESNEALYEAISSAGWSSAPKDPKAFLGQYFASRYACDAGELEPFVDGLLGSVYDNFANTDNHSWVGRPMNFNPNIFNINQGYYDAVSHLVSLSSRLGGEALYRIDVLSFAADFLFAKADEIYREAVSAYYSGEKERGNELAGTLCSMLLDADRLLESHPLQRMQRFLDMAGRSATSEKERMQFRKEALRIVTTWDAKDIHDYANRMWSGLLRDYYVPRIRGTFHAIETGETYDIYALENAFIESVANEGFSPVEPFDDPVAAAKELVEKYGSYSMDPETGKTVAFWGPCSGKTDGVRNVVFLLQKDQVTGLKGFEFVCTAGGPVTIDWLKVGNIRVTLPGGGERSLPAGGGFYPWKGPSSDKGLEKTTKFLFEISMDAASAGYIKLVNG